MSASETKQGEHTPGPWRISEWDADSPGHLKPFALVTAPYDAEPQDIAYVGPSVPDDCDTHGKAEQLANAHLIAAAPSLLAACKAWSEFAESLERGTLPDDPIRGIREKVHGDRLRQTRAAIALAEGRA